MKFVHAITFVLTVTLIAGCTGGVRTPFFKMRPDYSQVPEQELRAIARDIENAILRGDRNPPLAAPPGVVVDDPAVQQAIRTRAARTELVQALLATGFAYEQKGGLISLIRSAEYKRATNARQRDKNALVVMSENADRWAVYEGLVEASNWPPAALGAVQNAFFEARRDLLEPGFKYESESGDIVIK